MSSRRVLHLWRAFWGDCCVDPEPQGTRPMELLVAAWPLGRGKYKHVVEQMV